MNGVQSGAKSNVVKALVLEENDNCSPCKDDINMYAQSIGIIVEMEPELMHIAREGIVAPIPPGWQVLQDENNEIFYYNSSTGLSLWEHPLDQYYRDLVTKTRKRNQKSTNNQNTKFISPNIENNKISKTTEVTNNPSSVVPANNNKINDNNNTSAIFLSRSPQVNKDNKPHLSNDHCSETVQNGMYNKDDKKEVDLKGSIEELLVFDEPPTEYSTLKPSTNGKNFGRCSLNLSAPSKLKSQAACQTEVVTQKNGENWSQNYSSALRKANHHLSLLQTRIRQSLLSAELSGLHSSNIENKRSVNKYHNNRLSSFHRLSLKQTNSNVHHDQCIDLDSLCSDIGFRKHMANNGPSSVCEFSHLNDHSFPSPAVDNVIKCETILSNCPEVGISPSDIKSIPISYEVSNEHEIHVSKIDKQLMPIENCTVKDKNSTNEVGKMEQQIDENENISKNLLNTNNCNSALSISLKSKNATEFAECINHLIEERSRLQKKLLRLKLLYKTYKLRLDSLDASLLTLQQSSVKQSVSDVNQVSPKEQSVEKLEKKNHKVDQNSGFIQPRIQSPCSNLIQSEEHSFENNEKSRDRVSVSIQRSTTPVSRRSLSVPRTSINPLRSRSDFLMAENQKHDRLVSRDLAHSLASIDAQLHRVLNHLDSDTSDSYQMSPYNCLHTECSCAMNSTCPLHGGFDLQHDFANLSLSNKPPRSHYPCPTKCDCSNSVRNYLVPGNFQHIKNFTDDSVHITQSPLSGSEFLRYKVVCSPKTVLHTPQSTDRNRAFQCPAVDSSPTDIPINKSSIA